MQIDLCTIKWQPQTISICPSKIIWPLISITTCWNSSSNAFNFQLDSIHISFIYILFNDHISEMYGNLNKKHGMLFSLPPVSLPLSLSLSIWIVNSNNEHFNYIATRIAPKYISIQYIYNSETNAMCILEAYQRIWSTNVIHPSFYWLKFSRKEERECFE